MSGKPFEKSNKRLRAGIRLQIATVICAVLTIVGFAAHIMALGIVFLVLLVLCAAAWAFLMFSGIRAGSRDVDRIVAEETAKQQRRTDS